MINTDIGCHEDFKMFIKTIKDMIEVKLFDKGNFINYCKHIIKIRSLIVGGGLTLEGFERYSKYHVKISQMIENKSS